MIFHFRLSKLHLDVHHEGVCMWCRWLSSHCSQWRLNCSSDPCKIAIHMCSIDLCPKCHWLPFVVPHQRQSQGCSPAAMKVPMRPPWPLAAYPGSRVLLWLLCQIWQLRGLEAPVHDLALSFFSLKRFVLGLTPVLNIYILPSSLDQNGVGATTSKSFLIPGSKEKVYLP